ncbi:unnamed protein product [Ectocarpus sp. 12 AP-2014]
MDRIGTDGKPASGVRISYSFIVGFFTDGLDQTTRVDTGIVAKHDGSGWVGSHMGRVSSGRV